jgi:hypothetical protein
MPARLAAARPAAAHDRCVIGGQTYTGDDVYDHGPCADAYPIHGDPRTAAGAPRSNDILRCARTPVDPASYRVPFTEAQAERLRHIFPDGVCDWSKPGIGQVPLQATWIRHDGNP